MGTGEGVFLPEIVDVGTGEGGFLTEDLDVGTGEGGFLTEVVAGPAALATGFVVVAGFAEVRTGGLTGGVLIAVRAADGGAADFDDKRLVVGVDVGRLSVRARALGNLSLSSIRRGAKRFNCIGYI